MNAGLWAECWIGVALAGPLVAGVLGWVGSRAQREFLRGVLVLGTLALFWMGGQILSGHMVAGALPLPAPFPRLVFAPLPLAGLWSSLSGLLLLATGLLIWRHERAANLLWALVPMAASIGLFLLAGDGLTLLLGLEAVSLTSYLGLISSRRSRKIWNAGWVLLILSEMGGLLLILAIGLIVIHHGPGLPWNDSFPALARDAARISLGGRLVIMILVLLAFGVKAGLFPVMIWMPLAEPEAPGPIAGIFSGIFTALAILGMMAVERVVLPGMAWGVVLFVLGTVGAVIAALYSVVSRHVKQILAYSTLEILGLVFAALGIWAMAAHVAPLSLVSTLAWDAAMILLIMHAGSKFVLFALTEHTESLARTVDGLGGLARRFPSLSVVAAVGVATLAAIPPLGGFVGEWLLLEAILKPLGTTESLRNVHLLFVFGGIFLAMATALGVATYIRWFGYVFLGPERRPNSAAQLPQSIGRHQIAGYALALLPVLLAGPGVPWLIPWLNVQGQRDFLNNAQKVIAPLFVHPQAVPLFVHIGGTLVKAPGAPGTIFYPQGFSVGDPYVLLGMGLALALAVALVRAFWRRGAAVRYVRPWTGGTREYSPLTSFSAEGFVHPLRLAFHAFYGLQRERWSRSGVRFYRHTIIYRLEQQGYLPVLRAGQWVAEKIRKTQSGSTPLYLAYLMGATVLALALALWHPGA